MVSEGGTEQCQNCVIQLDSFIMGYSDIEQHWDCVLVGYSGRAQPQNRVIVG